MPQILYTGIGNTVPVDEALSSLVKDMANEKQKLARKEESNYEGPVPDNHPILMALKAIEEVADEYK